MSSDGWRDVAKNGFSSSNSIYLKQQLVANKSSKIHKYKGYKQIV